MAYVTWLPSFRAGEPVGIRVVGGGALALRYFERRTTVDIDVVQVTPGDEITVIAAVERIADRRGWQRDWLNLKGDSRTDRAHAMVERILEAGLLKPPAAPPAVEL